MWRIGLLLVFGFSLHAVPQPGARHYSYHGDDPAGWTVSTLSPPSAGQAADFTALPCEWGDCTVGKVVSDGAGNLFVTGGRRFTTQTAAGPMLASEVYVAKLDASGATVFLATFSGKGSEEGRAIALDPEGNIVVGGETSSWNFPLRNAVQNNRGATGSTGFVLKLSPDGSRLIFSTYFGGTANSSSVAAVATGKDGGIYVAGQTGSRDFPATEGMPAGPATGLAPGGVLGAFFAKLTPSGDRIAYSGRISGSSVSCGAGSSCFLSMRNVSALAVGVDSAGNAYFAGHSNVTDLPTTPGVLAAKGIGAWVARVNASGKKLDYLTYLGTANHILTPFSTPGNQIRDMTVDAAGNAHLAGATFDPSFPLTPGAYQTKLSNPGNPQDPYTRPPFDAFVAKLNPQGTAMVYATLLGGRAEDSASAISVDASGAAYVTGTTASADFPNAAGASAGGDFLAVVNPSGSALTFASRYPKGAVASAVAAAGDGRAVVASATGVVSALSLNSPARPRMFGVMNAAGGSPSNWVAPGEVVSIYGTNLGTSTGVSAMPDATGTMPFSLAGVRLLFDGKPAPLLYVSSNQINAVAPFSLVPGKPVRIRVETGGALAEELPAIICSSQLAIFPIGNSAALNEDGSRNSMENPARRGSIVSIWATGTGAVSPLPEDGRLAEVPQEFHACTLIIAGKSVEPLYCGAAPGTVAGVVQVNFRIPVDTNVTAPSPLDVSIRAYPSARVDLAFPYTFTVYVSP